MCKQDNISKIWSVYLNFMQTSSYVLFYFPLRVSTLAERLEMLSVYVCVFCGVYLQCKGGPCLTVSVPVSTFWFDVFALFSLL